MRYRACVFAFLSLLSVGCGRYSYRIRHAVDAGRYDAAVARCQSDSTAATAQWNDFHEARYHVYCGMAYLGLGDGQRAAVELVQAERMRQLNPRLITGRDLAKLSQGLVQLFGVPAGQLSIEETRGQVAAAPPAAPPVAVVPAPAPAPEDPPPAPNAPSVMVRGQVSATIAAPPAPEVTVVPPDGAAAEAPGAAPPPVIVIPEEQGAVIE